MPRYTFLDAQDSFADLTAAILHDRRLPIGVRSPQFFDQAPSKPKFGEGSLKSVFVLELFTLLRRQISLKKNIARIVLLRRKRNYQKKEKQRAKKSRGNPPHAATSRDDNQATGRFSFHRGRELVEWPGKVESFIWQRLKALSTLSFLPAHHERRERPLSKLTTNRHGVCKWRFES